MPFFLLASLLPDQMQPAVLLPLIYYLPYLPTLGLLFLP
jgi:hypothetical protein